jgi:shikimate kinase/3-dehydroquinate synthase
MVAFMNTFIFLYGPPGAGKSETGLRLASALDLPFIDLDKEITAQAGQSIPDIFLQEGEAGFRGRERAELEKTLTLLAGVVALGGGALVDPANRKAVEARGKVVCLHAAPEILLNRLKLAEGARPLLTGRTEPEMLAWLDRRHAHYQTFPCQLDTNHRTAEQSAWEIQVTSGIFHVSGMGPAYDVIVQPGILDGMGAELRQCNLKGPLGLVSDAAVGGLYGARVLAGLSPAFDKIADIRIPGGERLKTIDTVLALWTAFVEARLERGSTVVALGGGVVTDLAGFAAATYLRGVHWVATPTSLLGMVDASLGGKTGANLPQGKNLIGAFYPPRLVLADPSVLDSLPDAELRNGLAETVKAGVIGDVKLFERCSHGLAALRDDLVDLVRRAMAVKLALIQADPYERGQRAVLNLGHTVGHALEKVSDFAIPHGEGVAIGMVVEAHLAVKLGLAQPELPQQLTETLSGLGLPTTLPAGIDLTSLHQAMQVDKKRVSGVVRFALPVRIGEVLPGIPVDHLDVLLKEIYESDSGLTRP